MSSAVGIGVLGCGSVSRATQHLPALRRIPAGAVVALADPDPRRGARRAAGTRGRSPRLRRIAARPPDVDAVLIAAPTAASRRARGAAAAPGSTSTSRSLSRRVAPRPSRDRRCRSRPASAAAVGFNRRRHPLYNHARGVLAAGASAESGSVQTRLLGAGCARARCPDGSARARPGRRSPRPRLAPFRPHPLVPRQRARTRPRESDPSDPSRTRPGSTSRPDGAEVPDAALVPWARTRAQIEFFGDRGGPSVDRHRRDARPSRSSQQRRTGSGRVAPPVPRACSLERPAARGRAASRPTPDAGRLLGRGPRAWPSGSAVARGRGTSLEAVLETERLAGASERTDGR